MSDKDKDLDEIVKKYISKKKTVRAAATKERAALSSTTKPVPDGRAASQKETKPVSTSQSVSQKKRTTSKKELTTVLEDDEFFTESADVHLEKKEIEDLARNAVKAVTGGKVAPRRKPRRVTTATDEPICKGYIYFDNNATTLPCEQAIAAQTTWSRCFNASTSSSAAAPARKILEKSVNDLLSHCGVNTISHTAIFTSGASESNSFVINACIKAYKKSLKENAAERKPHLIISETEHSSIIKCADNLERLGEATVTKLRPTIYGNILPADVEQAIQINTCLISVMFANNELPIINNLNEIVEIAQRHGIPVHSDCVQIFGKFKINLKQLPVAAISISFHKFYGPKGVGACILRNDLIEGYGICAEIPGTQQNELRGGTENIAGIAGGMAALAYAHKNRKEKNAHLFELRDYLLSELAARFVFNDYSAYLHDDLDRSALAKVYTEALDDIAVTAKRAAPRRSYEKGELEIVSLGPPAAQKQFILPNTVLLSVCKNVGAPFCNVQLKDFLDKKKCIVSIGAACLTNSDKASHVVMAIGAPPVVRRGIIRVSFQDGNTKREINQFVKALEQGINAQCGDIEMAAAS